MVLFMKFNCRKSLDYSHFFGYKVPMKPDCLLDNKKHAKLWSLPPLPIPPLLSPPHTPLILQLVLLLSVHFWLWIDDGWLCVLFSVRRILLRLKLYHNISCDVCVKLSALFLWIERFSQCCCMGCVRRYAMYGWRKLEMNKLLNATMKRIFVCFSVVILWLSAMPLIIFSFSSFHPCTSLHSLFLSCQCSLAERNSSFKKISLKHKHWDHILFRFLLHNTTKWIEGKNGRERKRTREKERVEKSEKISFTKNTTFFTR